MTLVFWGLFRHPGRALWRGGITIGFVADGVWDFNPRSFPKRILQWFTNHPILGFEDAKRKTQSWKFGNCNEPNQLPQKFINSTKPKPGSCVLLDEVYAVYTVYARVKTLESKGAHQADWTATNLDFRGSAAVQGARAVVAWWCAFAAFETTTCCFIWDWFWLNMFFSLFSCRCERIACQWDRVSFAAGKDVCMFVKWFPMTYQWQVTSANQQVKLT